MKARDELKSEKSAFKRRQETRSSVETDPKCHGTPWTVSDLIEGWVSVSNPRFILEDWALKPA